MLKFIRTLTTIGGVALLVWLMRDRMVNLSIRRAPSPPEFRTSPPEHAAPPVEVTAIVGIGPVYAERLAAAGIGSVAELVHSGAEAVAEAAGVGVVQATRWIELATAAP